MSQTLRWTLAVTLTSSVKSDFLVQLRTLVSGSSILAGDGNGSLVSEGRWGVGLKRGIWGVDELFTCRDLETR